jgi:hypothetical protein
MARSPTHHRPNHAGSAIHHHFVEQAHLAAK